MPGDRLTQPTHVVIIRSCWQRRVPSGWLSHFVAAAKRDLLCLALFLFAISSRPARWGLVTCCGATWLDRSNAVAAAARRGDTHGTQAK
jgi:hypothetical protein